MQFPSTGNLQPFQTTLTEMVINKPTAKKKKLKRKRNEFHKNIKCVLCGIKRGVSTYCVKVSKEQQSVTAHGIRQKSHSQSTILFLCSTWDLIGLLSVVSLSLHRTEYKCSSKNYRIFSRPLLPCGKDLAKRFPELRFSKQH